MRSLKLKKISGTAGLAVLVLLLAANATFAAAGVVGLTAQPTTVTLPDGQTVPMWGLFCAPLSNTDPTLGPTCTATDGTAQNGTTWQPPLIRVATNTDLTINLTNSLPGSVPTSLMIVGQLGGGLGAPVKVDGPVHIDQGPTWPVQGEATDPVFTPPAQPRRIQSFGTEVPRTDPATMTPLLWNGLRAGTYLIESGTHPSIQGPMGLYGVLIVSDTATQGYTGVTYDRDVPLLLSEIDARQNRAAQTAVETAGFSETAVRVLRSKVSSISVATDVGSVSGATANTLSDLSASFPTSLTGLMVEVTRGGTTQTRSISSNTSDKLIVSSPWNPIPSSGDTYHILQIGGTGYHVGDLVAISGGGGAGAAAQVSATDPPSGGTIVEVEVTDGGHDYSSVPDVAASTGSHNAKLVANLTMAGVSCSDGAFPAAACYPPAVNYDPRYYLINGIAFNGANREASTFPNPEVAAPATEGKVLLRFVNAGLRMHIPSVVGLDMSLIAEDGNVLPGTPKKQNEVFLAAGKTHDVSVQPSQVTTPGTYDPKTYPVFDRQLSLSTNNQRDGGMQGYIKVNGGSAYTNSLVKAKDDNYYLVPGQALKVSDPAKGMIANDINVYGITVTTQPSHAAYVCKGGTLDGTSCTDPADLTTCTGGGTCVTTFKWNADGTFSYTPANEPSPAMDFFVYQANGLTSADATATVHLNLCDSHCGGEPVTGVTDEYTSNIATRLQISPSGVLANDLNPTGYPLTARMSDTGCTAETVGTHHYTCLLPGQLTLNADGSFTATPGGAGDYKFIYQAMQSHQSSGDTNVYLHFLSPSNLQVHVLDGPSTLPGKSHVEVRDYRWVIEEDRTFPIRTGANTPGVYVPNLGANFHSSYMPLVAQGCVGAVACEVSQTVLDAHGQHVSAVCDVGNGGCRPGVQQAEVDPSQVHLDPTKQYYISILPGDGANAVVQGSGGPVDNPDGSQRPFSVALDCPTLDANHNGFIDADASDGTKDSDFAPGTGACGHAMGGAPIRPGAPSVNVVVQETPLPPAQISVFVFEDDNPLNGEVDAGGGVDILAPNEPGLGGFNIVLLDQAGGLGDSTGQPTYDMFNMPLNNSLAGTIDPTNGNDACPISITPPKVCQGGTKNGSRCSINSDCPGRASDGIAPGTCEDAPDRLVGMIVTCPKYESDGTTLSPLAGQALIANLYPGLYEVVATPGADRSARGEEWLQTNTLDGTKPLEAFIRPNEPSYFQEFGPAGFHVSIGFANPAIIKGRKAKVCAHQPCDVTVTGQISGARISRTPDQRIYGTGSGDAFGFTQCYVSLGEPGSSDYAFTKCDPDGTFTLTGIPHGKHRITVFDQWNDIIVDGLSIPINVDEKPNLGEIPIMQWRTNLSTRTFIDVNGDGLPNRTPDGEDLEPGLPLVSTNLRYRDGSFLGFNNTDLNGYAGFNEIFPFFNWMVLEADTTRYKQTGVHVVYDAGGAADCTTPPGVTPAPNCSNIAKNIASTMETVPLPTELRVPGAVYCSDADCSADNLLNRTTQTSPGGSTGRIDPPWFTTEGWQGFAGETQFLEFGKAPFADSENGGIKGHVVYASTRPFDDPRLLLQLSWEPLVPLVTVNLYKKGTAPDGTDSLTLVDTTTTTSWDDWAQGAHPDGLGHMIPNMNCPGQSATSPFYFTLQNSTQWLHPENTLPNDSQFKCYDGMPMLNQVQPAPYDGMYQFPSVTSRDPSNGQPTGSNCTACIDNPADLALNPPRHTKMLPAAKYVVEMIVPPGYELVKEEDKNILLGDVFIAPVAQQFGGLGSIFIMPDQAEVDEEFNPTNPLNATNNEGVQPRHEGDTGSVEAFWPCVGQSRVVPDYMSLFPQATQAAPFAGASRNLCDRKEVTLEDQSSVLAKFYVFTSTHITGHFTGIVTDDNGSEFDPFSPNYGEKFAVPNLPISFKDFTGNEVARTYTDQWGSYNGLHYSTWEVNPPNPTGYGPSMAIACMNDSGRSQGGPVDPLFNPGYSEFCYEWSLMPGQTAYMDTPVVPTMAFGEGYNPPDCAYPDHTPAIKQVNGDGLGPWVSATKGEVNSLTLTDQGDGYTSNPSVTINGGGFTTQATATADLKIREVFRSGSQSQGNLYRSVPAVSFTGGGGVSDSAAATAVMRVNSVDIPVTRLNAVNAPVGGGSGYTSAPTVTFPGGTGGVFSVTMRVDSIVLSNPGAGYTSRPSTTITGGAPGSGAAASNGTNTGTFLGVTSVLRSSGGSGYTSPPGVSISLPSCTINGTTCVRAVYHAIVPVTPGPVTGFVMDNPGAGYTSRPTVTIVNTGHGGTGAAAVNGTSTGTFLSIDRVVLSNNGSGYTNTRPTVTFTAAPSGGTNATANPTATTGAFFSVNAVGVTSGGSGYTGTTGTFSGGGASGGGAEAVAALNVDHVSVDAGGYGFTSVPTVAIALPGRSCPGGPLPGDSCNGNSDCRVCLGAPDTHCTQNSNCASGTCLGVSPVSVCSSASGNGATATARMSVNGVYLTNEGVGYTTNPTSVTIHLPPGTGTNCSPSATCVAATAGATARLSDSTLTITALGDQSVPNHLYSGPEAVIDPYNQKFITRHYDFGPACSGTCSTGSHPVCGPGAVDAAHQQCASGTCVPDAGCNAVSSVAIGGVPAPVTWGTASLTVTVPGNVPKCDLQQRIINGPGNNNNSSQTAECGELVITSGNGKRSVDTVTVTVGGKPPTHVTGENSSNNAIQTAIDNATPGDLIMVDPGTYNEMVLMWKPVRLQGVGAPIVTINADPHPGGKIDPWRLKVLHLFGLGADARPDGSPIMVDRVPLEGMLGWDTTVNGNLAELLQEPTLMGAYEGGGISVLAKGVNYNGGDPFEPGTESAFPAGTTLLTNSNSECNAYQANFLCNPSRIDGLTITNSSQGGGGIFTHGWNHHLEVSNNRVFGNSGTASGGISIGQGEFGDPNIAPQDAAAVVPPLTPTQFPTLTSVPDGTQLPYWLQTYVSVHNNAVTENASYGDALYSTTPAAAGGVTFYTGSDYYNFDHNWVCGNLSSGDGGGVAQLGFIYNDSNSNHGIRNNSILFNQSENPTIPTHGGGLLVSGAGPDGQTPQCANATGIGSGDVCSKSDVGANCETYACNGGSSDGAACTVATEATDCPGGGTCDPETCQLLECGTNTDVDCPPGITEGSGPGLLVDSNLIQGNTAESGSGGGIRLQLINGTDVGTFNRTPANWYQVNVQNNVIVNNVAGWDGGGVSMQDALRVNFVNNSVLSNDSTASSGVLFTSFGAGTASVPPPGDPACAGCTLTHYLPAGLVTMENTPNLVASLPVTGTTPNLVTEITCPSDGGTANPYANHSVCVGGDHDAQTCIGDGRVCDSGSRGGQTCTTNTFCHGPGNSNPSASCVNFCTVNNHPTAACVATGNCGVVSLPVLVNDVFWQNRAFKIDVRDPAAGPTNQQHSVVLLPELNQPQAPAFTGGVVTGGTGACDLSHTPASSYWDIGVRGDGAQDTSIPTSGFRLNPRTSVLTANYSYDSSNYFASPAVASQYCNGSRRPPENGGTGYLVPPGVAQENIPNWEFTLNPAATVDEANNWINMSYGPLSLVTPSGAVLGQYVPTAASSATTTNHATSSAAPSSDFFGTPRKTGSASPPDIGAVEFPAPKGSFASLSANSLIFGSVSLNSLSPTQNLTVTNTGTFDLTVNNPDFTAALGFIRVTATSGIDCGTGSTFTLAAGASCNIGIQFAPTSSTGGSSHYDALLVVSTNTDGDVTQDVELIGTSSLGASICADSATTDGTPCDDGNACTRTDTCQAGVCVGTDSITCVAHDDCHVAGICDPGTGLCTSQAKSDGTLCTDDSCRAGSPCTKVDTCQAGSCRPVICVALDQCHDAGTPDAATGVCSNPVKSNGSACEDGNPCTESDSCQAGHCAGGNAVICVAVDQCHLAGTCDPASGGCSQPVMSDGIACDDGDPSTCGDVCGGGSCHGTSAGAQPDAVNDSVTVAKQGSDASIGWSDSPGSFNVYRGTITPGQPFAYNHGCLNPTGPTTDQSVIDPATPPPGKVYYYVVTRIGQCSESIPGRDSSGNAIPNNHFCPDQGGDVSIVALSPSLETGTTTAHSGTITLTYNGATSFTLTAAPQITRTFGSGAFAIAGGTCVSGLTLNPSGECTINVQYTPPGDISPSTATVSISGTGSAPGTTYTSESFNAD